LDVYHVRLITPELIISPPSLIHLSMKSDGIHSFHAEKAYKMLVESPCLRDFAATTGER
jgi:hypothetical protein